MKAPIRKSKGDSPPLESTKKKINQSQSLAKQSSKRSGFYSFFMLCSENVVLVLGVSVLLMMVWYGFYDLPNQRRNSLIKQTQFEAARLRLGISAGLVTMLTCGGLFFPSSIQHFPHPALWRVCLSGGVIYLAVLMVFLFLDGNAPMRLLQWYDSQRGKPLPERSYAEDCRIVVDGNIFYFVSALDIFVAAHFFGYIIKMLIFRDWKVVTCISIGFEFIELSLQHVVLNFRECWWDHLLLDVLICNGGGTILGLLVLRLFKAKEYDFIVWHGGIGQTSRTAKLEKSHLNLLTKAHKIFFKMFDFYSWNVFRNPKRFFYVLVLLGFVLIQETNTFLSKSMLNLTPSDPLVLLRLAAWALLSIPAAREYYEFVSNPNCKVLGVYSCVAFLGVTAETVLMGKMIWEGPYFKKPLMPISVLIPLTVACSVFTLWLAIFFLVVGPIKRALLVGKKPRFPMVAKIIFFLSNIMFGIFVVSMVGLFVMNVPQMEWGKKRFENATRAYVPLIFP